MLLDFTATFGQMATILRLLREQAQPCTVHITAMPGVAIPVMAPEQPPILKRRPGDLRQLYCGELVAPFTEAPQLPRVLRLWCLLPTAPRSLSKRAAPRPSNTQA